MRIRFLILIAMFVVNATAPPFIAKAGTSTQSCCTAKAAGLTPEWLERLGKKRVLFMWLQDSVIVLAAQDATIVGKRYRQTTVFGSPQGHGTLYIPFNKDMGGGKEFFIPVTDTSCGMVEVPEAQEEELLRLAKEYSSQP